MFAVLKFGHRQYKVVPGEAFVAERIEADEGSELSFDTLVMFCDDKGTVLLKSDDLKDYVVITKILKQFRDKKVHIFKKKRRKGYTRKKGHRQYKTLLEVIAIVKKK